MKLSTAEFKKLLNAPPPSHKVVTMSEPPFVSESITDTKRIADMTINKKNTVIVDGKLSDSDALKEAKDYFNLLAAKTGYIKS